MSTTWSFKIANWSAVGYRRETSANLPCKKKPYGGDMTKKLIAILCTTSAIALAAPANAAAVDSANTPQAASAADDQSDAIIVTARRRDEDVQKIPLVVNTVTGASIAKLNLQNFTEIQALVPGLQMSPAITGIGAGAQMRGLTYDGNSGAQPSVEFYLNDAPLTSVYVQQQMYDVGQIEVQSGPQGTLRGRSSPSGSITVTTKKPDLQKVGGYISMSGSDIATINTNGAINLPIIKDVLAVRAAGLWTESDDNRIKTINTNLGGGSPHSRTGAGRISARFEPTDWLHFDGVYQHASINTRHYDQYASYSLANPSAPVSALLITPGDRLSIEKTPQTIHQTFDIFNWRAEARVSGQVLIYQGQHAKLHADNITDSDIANHFPADDFYGRTDSNSTTTSHEVRLQNESRVAGMFDYVVGFFHEKQDSPTTLNNDTAITLPDFLGGGLAAIAPIGIATRQTINETSFFGNVTAHIGDKLQLSGGARAIHLTSPASPLLLTAGGSTNPLGGTRAVDDHKWIYSASVQYFITPDFMIYANTGTSYRPGPSIIGNFSLVQSSLEQSFMYMKPETSTNYELGLKTKFLNGRGHLDLTGYHQIFHNYTYKLTSNIFYNNFTFASGAFVPGIGSSAQFGANVPVEVNGVDLDVGFKVSPRFTIGVVASYSIGRIKNGVIPCNGSLPAGTPTVAQLQAAFGTDYIGSCVANMRASSLSPFSATIQAEYNVPVSEKATFFTRGLLSYKGNSLNDPTNPYDNVGSYGVLNMFVGLRDPEGAWEVNLFAKNLTNIAKATTFNSPAVTSYQALTFASPPAPATAGGSSTSTYSQIVTNSPREFGINVRYAFGSR